MQVILIEDVKGTGKKGDTVKVKDGYAHNFLFPKKLAIEANATNLNLLAGQKASAQHRLDKQMKAAKEASDALNGKSVKIAAKAGQGGKLFGAVTAKEISNAIKEQYGFDVDKKKIALSEDIKTYGVFSAQVKLSAGISAEVSVNVNEG